LQKAAESPPPAPDEILATCGELVGEIDSYEKPVFSGQRVVRGWRVWYGSYSRYEREQSHEIHRTRDPVDPQREFRIHRRAEWFGARLHHFWLTITGHAL
ncbi:MAG: hypothetical protein ACREID_08905, partial [Planctomycetota bacterium]